jgi:hypothetical protein
MTNIIVKDAEIIQTREANIRWMDGEVVKRTFALIPQNWVNADLSKHPMDDSIFYWLDAYEWLSFGIGFDGDEWIVTDEPCACGACGELYETSQQAHEAECDENPVNIYTGAISNIVARIAHEQAETRNELIPLVKASAELGSDEDYEDTIRRHYLHGYDEALEVVRSFIESATE